jgi:hypothetical protein
MLWLSLTGCATPDPLAGWKSEGWQMEGNSGSAFGPAQDYVAAIPYDKAILKDVQAFLKTLPVYKDQFGDSNGTDCVTNISYFQDGAGRHAVRITAELKYHSYTEFYLIYDKSNVRTAVIKAKVPAHLLDRYS